MQSISVVGLGKLGAPLAASFAAKGHRVIGVDSSSKIVALINQGKSPVYEPGLQDLILASDGRLTATSSYEEAISASDITFLVVPTPSDPEGGFSVQYVLAAARSIGKALAAKDSFHLVSLTSTVMPGTTSGQLLPVLEESSGKRCGRDFGLCYSPEFIALGSVIRDMANPDLVLIGESDRRSGDLLTEVFNSLCDNDPPIVRINFVNAELAKLALNTFVTMKISYANVLAQLCERYTGADVDVVTSTIGLDKRIGLKYLKGALGYGGPCFPRDTVAFTRTARQVGVEAWLSEATNEVNVAQVPRLAEEVRARLRPGGTVGILGLAYKPHTNVVEESQGLELARELLAHSIKVVVHDPAAMDSARAVLGEDPIFASSMKECAGRADVLVITTPWPEFSDLAPSHLKADTSRPAVIDCWRILDPGRFHDCADYVAVGVCSTGSRVEAASALVDSPASSSEAPASL